MMSMDLGATPSQECMFGITLPRRKSQNVSESVVPVWSHLSLGLLLLRYVEPLQETWCFTPYGIPIFAYTIFAVTTQFHQPIQVGLACTEGFWP